MFEKALGFFGLQKKEKGHILGDGDRRKGGVNNGSNYDVVFESASSLGLEFGEISIDKSTNGKYCRTFVVKFYKCRYHCRNSSC